MEIVSYSINDSTGEPVLSLPVSAPVFWSVKELVWHSVRDSVWDTALSVWDTALELISQETMISISFYE